MFQQPSQGGDKVPFGEMIGSLVLIWAREHRTEIPTVHGEKDAIAGDVHCLDGTHGGEVFADALIFQGALIGSLRPAVGGEPVLARVGQGVGKPGQNPPFILLPFTDADAAAATAYIQRMPKPFQAPAAQQQTGPTQAAATASPSPAAAPPSSAAPATAPGVDYRTLPPEVVVMLHAAGQIPPAAVGQLVAAGLLPAGA